MRKIVLIAFFSVLATMQIGQASAQNVEFRGTFVITKLNQPCSDVGWFLGDLATLRFRPGGVGSNTVTGFSYFFPFFAEGYRYGGPYTDLTQGDFVNVSGAGVGSTGNFTFASSLRFTSLKPGNLTANTNFVRIAGQFRDFDGTPGCNISFRGSLNRRV